MDRPLRGHWSGTGVDWFILGWDWLGTVGIECA